MERTELSKLSINIFPREACEYQILQNKLASEGKPIPTPDADLSQYYEIMHLNNLEAVAAFDKRAVSNLDKLIKIIQKNGCEAGIVVSSNWRNTGDEAYLRNKLFIIFCELVLRYINQLIDNCIFHLTIINC